GPPATATMVCGQEIKEKVKQVLSLTAEPGTHSTWTSSVYTCSYALPSGRMTLTVQVFPDKARAGAQLDAGQASTPGSQPLAGLGRSGLQRARHEHGRRGAHRHGRHR